MSPGKNLKRAPVIYSLAIVISMITSMFAVIALFWANDNNVDLERYHALLKRVRKRYRDREESRHGEVDAE